MSGVEVGQLRHKLLGPVRDLRVVLQQAGQRLPVSLYDRADHGVRDEEGT